jgi:lipopolysaccharide biosynthesis glycosyltransferase
MDIKNETMETLRKQVNLFSDFSLNFVDMSQCIKDYNFFVSRHITIEAYFRLFIPYIFPNLEKTIYFDCDMVCLTDISQLFNTDISNCFVGGVRDYSGLLTYYCPKRKRKRYWTKENEVLFNMEQPENYINSGMLLINCEKFRETYTLQNVLDIAFSRKWQCHDQDVINVLAKDKILGSILVKQKLFCVITRRMCGKQICSSFKNF